MRRKEIKIVSVSEAVRVALETTWHEHSVISLRGREIVRYICHCVDKTHVLCSDCGGDGSLACCFCGGANYDNPYDKCGACEGQSFFECETCNGKGIVEVTK